MQAATEGVIQKKLKVAIAEGLQCFWRVGNFQLLVRPIGLKYVYPQALPPG